MPASPPWPNPLIALVFVSAFVTAVLLAPVLRRLLSGSPGTAEQHAGSYEVFKLLGQLTGVFLIFLLVQAMNYYREAEIAVAREAGNVLQLDRALAEVTLPAGDHARERLRDYTGALVDREWPAMRRGAVSKAAAAALRSLQHAVSALRPGADPAALRTVQKALNDVEDDRTVRAGAAENRLPPTLWWVTAALFCLIVATAAFLSSPHDANATLGFYAAGLALLAALLVMVDGPFQGHFTVSPRPLQRALLAMEQPRP